MNAEFAQKVEDPAHLHFKQDKLSVNQICPIHQDIRHFALQGYTSLLDTSTELGCLIYGIRHTLRVFTNQMMHSLVT